MKSKMALLSLVSFLFTFAVSAQEIENDDMYFNSKDREKLKALKGTEVSYTASIKNNRKEKEKVEVEEEEALNPTDSYSARNVNPEYEARSNAQSAQSDNEDYFVSNYHYNNASSYNNWNNNFNRWYSNPWYGANYYDPYINSWNSPYYGSYYDQWGNPWRNPYYRSGWSTSFSYYWGSSWDYGWGMGFGYGNMNPYYNSWAWSPYAGYSPWGSYYGWGYPSTIVVVEGNRYAPVYGKRNSRSSNLSREASRTSRTYQPDAVNGTGRPAIGGRASTSTSRTQSDYYNRGWRNQTQQNNNPSYSNPNSTRSSWESNTRSSWRESNSGGNSNNSYSPSRSSGFDSGRSSGGGGSSSGSNGGGSSSGSRSSGRGH